MTQLWSEQSKSTDYITIKGLTQILGLRKMDLPDFILQELFDNAIDWIDSHTKEFIKSNKKPYIHLITSKEENGKVTRITVRNSNLGKHKEKEILTDDQIKKIFDFDNFYSSKRNQYCISRGALGGAFKEILGIPYALAVGDTDNNNSIANYEDWKYPLQINISNKRLIEVRVEIIDKIKSIPKSKIDIKSIDIDIDNNDYTEISVYIPTKDYTYLIGRFWHTFKAYALANTYIDFKSKFDGFLSPSHPATQDIKKLE